MCFKSPVENPKTLAQSRAADSRRTRPCIRHHIQHSTLRLKSICESNCARPPAGAGIFGKQGGRTTVNRTAARLKNPSLAQAAGVGKSVMPADNDLTGKITPPPTRILPNGETPGSATQCRKPSPTRAVGVGKSVTPTDNDLTRKQHPLPPGPHSIRETEGAPFNAVSGRNNMIQKDILVLFSREIQLGREEVGRRKLCGIVESQAGLLPSSDPKPLPGHKSHAAKRTKDRLWRFLQLRHFRPPGSPCFRPINGSALLGSNR